MEKPQMIDITSKFFKEGKNPADEIAEQAAWIIDNLKGIQPKDERGTQMKEIIIERLKAILLHTENIK